MVSDQSPASGPRGLSGWLIIPMIGTHLSIMFIIAGFVENASAIQRLDLSRRDLAALMAFDLATGVLLAAGWILAAILLWRRKAAFPKLFIWMCVAGIAVIAVDLAALSLWFELPLRREDGRALGRQIFSSLIWIPYMLMSKRVRNTFIH